METFKKSVCSSVNKGWQKAKEMKIESAGRAAASAEQPPQGTAPANGNRGICGRVDAKETPFLHSFENKLVAKPHQRPA